MAAQFSYFTTSDDLREIVKQVDANLSIHYQVLHVDIPIIFKLSINVF